MSKGKSRGIGLEPAMAMPKMTKEDMRFRAESDMRTMHEAHSIMGDKKRMTNVERVMHESMSVMEKMKKLK